MDEAGQIKPDHSSEDMNKVVARATENARAKNARLRQLKERNENYLADRKDDYDTDEEKTPELT
jgi:hypothetical protein